jgi:MFS family permease
MPSLRSSNFVVLRHRNVALAIGAQFLAATAWSAQIVATGFLLYEATGSKAALGLLGLVEFIPMIALVFVTGPFADRRDRRTIAGVCVAIEAVVAVGLAFYLRDRAATQLPFLVAALSYGIARAFAAPASRALLPAVTPIDEVERALPLGAIAWQAAAIIGPLAGGWLADVQGWLVFVWVGCLFVLAALCFAMIPSQPPAADMSEQPTGDGRMGFGDAFAGLRLIRRQPVLFGAISLDLFAVLFGGAVALLPAVAKDILDVGGTGLGFLRVAIGAGGVVMGLVLAVRPVRRHVGRVLLITVAVFGVFTIVFGLSRNYALSWVALFVLSAADMVSVYIRTTLVPLATPDSLRGRVLAVEAVFIGASNELGAAESGFAAALLGTVAAIVSGGVATLVIVGVWFVLFKPLANVDRFDEVKPLE